MMEREVGSALSGAGSKTYCMLVMNYTLLLRLKYKVTELEIDGTFRTLALTIIEVLPKSEVNSLKIC